MIRLVAKSVHLQSGAEDSYLLPATCYLETRLMRAVRRTCNRCLSPQVPPKRKQKQTFHFKNIYVHVCLQQHSGSTTGSDFFFFLMLDTKTLPSVLKAYWSVQRLFEGRLSRRTTLTSLQRV